MTRALATADSPIYVLMQREQAATISGNVIEATGEPYDRRHNN